MSPLWWTAFVLFSLAIAAIAIVALSIAVGEVWRLVDNRRMRRVVNARLAADREVADLDAIPVPGRWETSF